jgi:hypothetical protein
MTLDISCLIDYKFTTHDNGLDSMIESNISISLCLYTDRDCVHIKRASYYKPVMLSFNTLNLLIAVYVEA